MQPSTGKDLRKGTSSSQNFWLRLPEDALPFASADISAKIKLRQCGCAVSLLPGCLPLSVLRLYHMCIQEPVFAACFLWLSKTRSQRAPTLFLDGRCSRRTPTPWIPWIWTETCRSFECLCGQSFCKDFLRCTCFLRFSRPQTSAPEEEYPLPTTQTLVRNYIIIIDTYYISY